VLLQYTQPLVLTVFNNAAKAAGIKITTQTFSVARLVEQAQVPLHSHVTLALLAVLTSLNFSLMITNPTQMHMKLMCMISPMTLTRLSMTLWVITINVDRAPVLSE
jgi:hypothetical protein